jgi:DNA replication protein DnaC
MNPEKVFEQMAKICEQRGEKFSLDRFKNRFGNILEWSRLLSHLDSYEKNPKGFALIGTVGVGKSLFMQAMAIVSDVSIIPAARVVEKSKHAGDLRYYYQNKTILANESYSDDGKTVYVDEIELTFCFDGIGDIVDRIHLFGQEVNPFQDVFYERGERFQKTHLTSNLNDLEFIERYGSAAWSRINKICEIYVIKSETEDERRKETVQ